MFERYTEKARRVVFYGKYEANSLGADFLTAEHLILGMLREEKMLIATFLPAGKSTEDLIDMIKELIGGNANAPKRDNLPLSSDARRLLAYAATIADQCRSKLIYTQHILLASFKPECGVKAEVLSALKLHGITADSCKDRFEPRSSAVKVPESGLHVTSDNMAEKVLADIRATASSEERLRIANDFFANEANYVEEPIGWGESYLAIRDMGLRIARAARETFEESEAAGQKS